MNRELRIDFIRGLAMLTIAINHLASILVDIGYTGAKIPTLTSFGFSSAAEIFFILSGYMVGLVYSSKENVIKISLRRALRIYIYNVVTLFALIAISPILPDLLIQNTDLNYTISDPLKGIILFLLFMQHPYLLGILQVYVLFMVFLPIILILINLRIYATIFFSVLLYVITQIYPSFRAFP